VTSPAARLELLHVGAAGLPTEQAAIGLLAAHAHWLDRPDFIRHIATSRSALDPEREIAVLDWPAALAALDTGGLPSSASERRMLRLAASLADQAEIRLGDAVTSLDYTTSRIFINAIAPHCRLPNVVETTLSS